MKYRSLGITDLQVSELGFGVWTIGSNGWGRIPESDGVNLLFRALDLGINFFDTADIYGDGYGELILAKALKKQRHDIIISTKVGYDFYTNPITVSEGNKEHPQKFTAEFVRFACEKSLRRLDTDYIDLYQLHNPGLDTLEQDELFDTLKKLVEEGKIRYYGVALGPDIGCFDEGATAMREREISTLQITYSMLEQDSANRLFPIAQETKTGLITRVPHALGLLDGTYTKDTIFDANEHRSHPRSEWIVQGVRKVAQLKFLTDNLDASIGQIAIKFVLSGPLVGSVLPNITNLPELEEFVKVPDIEPIPEEFLNRIRELYDENFYLDTGHEPSAIDGN